MSGKLRVLVDFNHKLLAISNPKTEYEKLGHSFLRYCYFADNLESYKDRQWPKDAVVYAEKLDARGQWVFHTLIQQVTK